MTARQVALALAVSLALVPARAQADTHKVDMAFAPFSYVDQSSLFGFDMAIGFTFKKPGVDHEEEARHAESGDPRYGHPWSFMVDLGAHFYGDDDTEITTMVGVRRYLWKKREKLPEATIQRTRAAGEPVHPETKVALFLQGLAGVSHRADLTSRDTDPAAAPGLGIEWMPTDGRRKGLRIQGDWIFPLNGGDSYPRISLFLVFRQPFSH